MSTVDDATRAVEDAVAELGYAEQDLVEAIDAARASGATWQAISEAMGATDRRYAQSWRARRPLRPGR